MIWKVGVTTLLKKAFSESLKKIKVTALVGQKWIKWGLVFFYQNEATTPFL